MATKTEAIKAVSILLAAYNDTRADREIFIRLASEALEQYSSRILIALVNPSNGIIAECKFMPSIAEMHEFCQEKAYGSDKPRPENPVRIEVVLTPEEQEHRRIMRERVNNLFDSLRVEMDHGKDYFQIYTRSMPPGRFTVNDPAYIKFINDDRKARKARREGSATNQGVG